MCQRLRPLRWTNQEVWVPKTFVLEATHSPDKVGYWFQGCKVWIPGTLQVANTSELPEKCWVQFYPPRPATKFRLQIPTGAIMIDHRCFRHSIPLISVRLFHDLAAQFHGLQDMGAHGA